MIKEKKLRIKGHPRNLRYYSELGYDVKVGLEFEVNTIHLMSGSSVKVTCICSECGLESSNCYKDYWDSTGGLSSNFYCIKCKGIKSKKTNLERYGVSNPMELDWVKEKVANTNNERYGVSNPMLLDSIKDKVKKTNNERWGVDNVFSNSEIKEKIKKKNLDKYGVEYPMQNFDIKEKSKSKNIQKFGVDSYSKTEEWLSRLKDVSLSKWGVEFYSKTEECKEVIRKTNLEKFGFECYTMTDEYKLKSKNKKERNTYKKFYGIIGEEYSIVSYKDEFFNIMHNSCGNEFEISKSLLAARHRIGNILCVACNPIGVHKSSIEIEVLNFLKEKKIECIQGDRTLLNGKELDIYLPQYKMAIEVNGLWWHSELYKGQKYHLGKTLLCRDMGIHLLHIWEDDWRFKKDIVKSIILNKIGIIENRTWSRKCDIREVNSKEARIFLDENHIQGFSSSSIKIGLFYRDELVSLMTFGWRWTNAKREYELIRFCNKKNNLIVGSASRLFKYFLNKHKVDEIISYSDISLFDGGMYSMLGFTKVSLSRPNYYWVVDGIKTHRFNWTKKKLVKKGYDSDKSEVEIMTELGYWRVFSCGQEKWIFSAKV